MVKIVLMTSVLFLAACNPLGSSKTESSFGTCGEASWKNSGPSFWPDFAACLYGSMSVGGSTSYKTTTFSFSNPNQTQFNSGILAPNGKIYGIPGGKETDSRSDVARDPSEVLVIDPTTNSSKLISFQNSTKTSYSSAVLAANGKIYGIPNAQPTTGPTKILVIDPVTDAVSTIDFSNPDRLSWRSAVIGPNGTIYGMPNSRGVSSAALGNGNPAAPFRTAILRIDPKTDSVTLLSFSHGEVISVNANSASSDNVWGGAIQAYDGNLYAFPTNPANWNGGESVLKIDEKTNTVSEISFDPGFAAKDNNLPQQQYLSTIIHPSGYAYMIPANGYVTGAIRYVDLRPVRYVPEGEGYLSFPNPKKMEFSGAVLASNGLIYGIPSSQFSVVNLLVFDPILKKISLGVDIPNPTGEAWRGAVLAPNGKMYAIPNTGSMNSTVLVIDPEANRNFNINALLSPYLNRF